MKDVGYWSAKKEVIGWLLDVVQETITLPQRKHQSLLTLLDSLSKDKKHISLKTWHKVINELKSMTLLNPSLKSMFSLLQEAFWQCTQKRIHLSQCLHVFLNNIYWLHNLPLEHTTRMREVLPSHILKTFGVIDASWKGIDGVFFHLKPTDSNEEAIAQYL